MYKGQPIAIYKKISQQKHYRPKGIGKMIFKVPTKFGFISKRTGSSILRDICTGKRSKQRQMELHQTKILYTKRKKLTEFKGSLHNGKKYLQNRYKIRDQYPEYREFL